MPDWGPMNSKEQDARPVPAPRLRFPGFDGAWEEKKLGKIAMMSSGGTPDSSVAEYYGGEIPWVSISDMTKSGKYLNRTERSLTLLGLRNSAAKIFPEKTILFAMYASIGKCNIANLPVSTSQAILGIIPAEDASVEYIYYFLAGNEEKYADMGQHGTQKNLNAGMVKALPIPLPPTLPEQTRIATALSSLDAAIAAHQSKQDALRQHKRGLMAGLFPAEGEWVPRLRFPEFEGAGEWEEKRLGEVLTIANGRDYKHLKPGNIPVYGTGGYMLSVDDYLHEGESVTIGRKGTIDKPDILIGKFWAVDTLFYTHSYRTTTARFILYIFQQINWRDYNSASGVPSLTKSTIDDIEIPLPTLPEQTRIAAALSSLDDLMAAQGDKIAALQTFKRGLIQQLFPAMLKGGKE